MGLCWSSSLLTHPGGKSKGPEHSSGSLRANYHLQMFPPRGGKPWCCKSPPSTFTARKDFFSFRTFPTTSGCQFICSSREEQRQFKHLSKSVFDGGKKNKQCPTVWVNCFKFWSIPVGLHRATHGERAQLTVIEWKPQSPFQHYILHAPGWRFNMHA